MKLNELTKALGVAAVLALGTTGAMAAGDTQKSMDEYSRIDDLPDNGSVTLKGVVDSISSNQKFVLRDLDGETIDVVTEEQNLNVSEGDHVKVSGQMQDEALGLGEEIQATSVSVFEQSPASDADDMSRSEDTQEKM